MTYENVIEMLEEMTGLPLAYDHFAEEWQVAGAALPHFSVSGTDNVFADDTVYQKIDELNIQAFIRTRKTLKQKA